MFLAANLGASARGPDDDFWYSPVPIGNGAYIGRGGDSAMRVATVYKCVRVRAETHGLLPLLVYRRLDGGGKDVAPEHPLYSLLHDHPNPWQTSMQWRQGMQAHFDLRGNCYSELIYSGSGRLDMLVPRHPDCVTVEVANDGLPRYKVRDLKTQRERTLVRGEMLHVAGLSLDGYTGLNPIEVQRESIGGAVNARRHGSRFFANAARPPLWIEYEGKFSTPEAKREWARAFGDGYSGANAGKTPVMEKGFKLHPISVNNADSEFMDWMKFTEVDICGLYRMPPHKIGILDRATWGNIEHQQIDFVTDTTLPSAVAWEQALLRDLDFGDECFAEFKLSVLLRGDTKSRFEAYGKAIQDGWMTRNEARGLENMNPIDGLDVPLEPMNMAPAGSRRAAQERGDAAAAGMSADRRALILASAAERVARKELAMWRKGGPVGADHARWVSEVLAVSESDATARAEALPGLFAACDPSTSDAEFISARTCELLRMGS